MCDFAFLQTALARSTAVQLKSIFFFTRKNRFQSKISFQIDLNQIIISNIGIDSTQFKPIWTDSNRFHSFELNRKSIFCCALKSDWIDSDRFKSFTKYSINQYESIFLSNQKSIYVFSNRPGLRFGYKLFPSWLFRVGADRLNC